MTVSRIAFVIVLLGLLGLWKDAGEDEEKALGIGA